MCRERQEINFAQREAAFDEDKLAMEEAKKWGGELNVIFCKVKSEGASENDKNRMSKSIYQKLPSLKHFYLEK